jgi:putative membrane protein
MTKVYRVSKEEKKNDVITFVVGIIVYAIVLVMASELFKNFYIESFVYAIIAALILSALNYTIKPVLVVMALPITILTYGIAYPIVNMLMLKICDIIMGDSFVIGGFLSMFFISIFISLLKLFLDQMITKKIGR